jgi:hypothetical protein
MFKYMIGGISAALVINHAETASNETAAPAENIPKMSPGAKLFKGG